MKKVMLDVLTWISVAIAVTVAALTVGLILGATIHSIWIGLRELDEIERKKWEEENNDNA